jgi:hypothetical protein
VEPEPHLFGGASAAAWCGSGSKCDVQHRWIIKNMSKNCYTSLKKKKSGEKIVLTIMLLLALKKITLSIVGHEPELEPEPGLEPEPH